MEELFIMYLAEALPLSFCCVTSLYSNNSIEHFGSALLLVAFFMAVTTDPSCPTHNFKTMRNRKGCYCTFKFYFENNQYTTQILMFYSNLYIFPGMPATTPCNSKFKIAAATALLLNPLLKLISSI